MKLYGSSNLFFWIITYYIILGMQFYVFVGVWVSTNIKSNWLENLSRVELNLTICFTLHVTCIWSYNRYLPTTRQFSFFTNNINDEIVGISTFQSVQPTLWYFATHQIRQQRATENIMLNILCILHNITHTWASKCRKKNSISIQEHVSSNLTVFFSQYCNMIQHCTQVFVLIRVTVNNNNKKRKIQKTT